MLANERAEKQMAQYSTRRFHSDSTHRGLVSGRNKISVARSALHLDSVHYVFICRLIHKIASLEIASWFYRNDVK